MDTITREERTLEAGDGTRLVAWQSRGSESSQTPLICANGIGVATFFWHYLEAHFAPTRPVIVWDYRGHGQSEWPRDLDDLSMEAMADDMRAVLEAFGHERAILLGHSMGCQVIYSFALRYPHRTAALVPMLGTYGRPVHTFLNLPRQVTLTGFMLGHAVACAIPGPLGRSQARFMSSGLGRRIVSRFARLSGLVHGERMRQRDLDAYLDHFGEFSPLIFFRMAEHMATHTARPYLEQIVAPTLVVAGEHDIFTPMACSEEAAARLPNARLVVLEGGSHAALVEQPERIHTELEVFLRDYEVDAPLAEALTASKGAEAPAGAQSST